MKETCHLDWLFFVWDLWNFKYQFQSEMLCFMLPWQKKLARFVSIVKSNMSRVVIETKQVQHGQIKEVYGPKYCMQAQSLICSIWDNSMALCLSIYFLSHMYTVWFLLFCYSYSFILILLFSPYEIIVWDYVFVYIFSFTYVHSMIFLI